MEKKNNHFVPKCLIKRWIQNNGKYDGVYVLNVKSKKIQFSSSHGKGAFSFASAKNLYILEKDGERLTNLEEWFDGLENSLSIFIDKFSKKNETLFNDRGHLRQLMMCLVSFKLRSKYRVGVVQNYIDNAPDYEDDDSCRITLENIVNETTRDSDKLFPVEFVVCKSKIPLLLCDNPLLWDFVDEYSFIPLAPDLVLAFKKAEKECTIQYIDIDMTFSTRLNDLFISTTQDWIVSMDMNCLQKILDEYDFTQNLVSITYEKNKGNYGGYKF